MTRLVLFLSIFIFLVSCSDDNADYRRAVKNISVREIERHVGELGSDSFMGRKPFTEGERITIGYLADQLREIGFEKIGREHV